MGDGTQRGAVAQGQGSRWGGAVGRDTARNHEGFGAQQLRAEPTGPSVPPTQHRVLRGAPLTTQRRAGSCPSGAARGAWRAKSKARGSSQGVNHDRKASSGGLWRPLGALRGGGGRPREENRAWSTSLNSRFGSGLRSRPGPPPGNCGQVVDGRAPIPIIPPPKRGAGHCDARHRQRRRPGPDGLARRSLKIRVISESPWDVG